ncbi:hypothetical protein [Methanoculleus formosensis]|uniref:hypothetical protein n=1 Tax=Methanoculleus formosensis TaxID=2590886 RepID=UPI0021C0B391|nr:hypothetical protein [Methanoculleus sp. Afa-1]
MTAGRAGRLLLLFLLHGNGGASPGSWLRAGPSGTLRFSRYRRRTRREAPGTGRRVTG